MNFFYCGVEGGRKNLLEPALLCVTLLSTPIFDHNFIPLTVAYQLESEIINVLCIDQVIVIGKCKPF